MFRELFKKKNDDLEILRKVVTEMANKPTQKEIIHGLESLRSKYELNDYPILSCMILDDCIKKVNELYAK